MCVPKKFLEILKWYALLIKTVSIRKTISSFTVNRDDN